MPGLATWCSLQQLCSDDPPLQQVLGLEAQPQAPHNAGSHHGLTRIIRLAYAEHPCYVPLLKRAFELWRQLEVESGQVGLLGRGLGLALQEGAHQTLGPPASALRTSLA